MLDSAGLCKMTTYAKAEKKCNVPGVETGTQEASEADIGRREYTRCSIKRSFREHAMEFMCSVRMEIQDCSYHRDPEKVNRISETATLPVDR